MNLKSILPFENYTLTTKLSTEEIRRRISENVEPKKNNLVRFFSTYSTKPYQGEVSKDSFTISRIISRGSRNSFLPIITGDITSFVGTTQIKIKMRLHIFVLIFMLFWFGLIGKTVVFGIINSHEILQNGPSADLVIPLTMFLFGCLLFTLPFKVEARKSKEFFAELFEGQETDQFI
jgi:hypothetical protein